MKVSLLTIGNEVVDGQIINRNASTLSEALLKCEFEMDQHLSVKDTLPEIHRALDYLSRTSGLIITTGGLGPTVDDCTRLAISQWLDQELSLFEDHWDQIQDKLTSRNVILREKHKQQAFAPRGAKMLSNPVGVAPAFFASNSKTHIVSLPGPPREIHGIWDESLRDLLVSELQPKSNLSLRTWICFGIAESEVQNSVLELLSSSGLDYGFRLSRPYVELKVWAPKKTLDKGLFAKIDKALKPWHRGSTIAEVRRPFLDKISRLSSVSLFDGLSRGKYLNIFKELCGKNISLEYFTSPISTVTKEGALQTMGRLDFRGDHKIGFFPISGTRVLVVENDKSFEFETYRNIPISTSLGQLVVLEEYFQNHGI